VGAPETPFAAVNALSAARPNPFHGETTLDYTLAKETVVDLGVYDLLGRRVRTLVSGTRPPGTSNARWDGMGDDGRRASAGVYFVRMVTPDGGKTVMRKVTLTP
jgi:flagellar hook assembly protein FlgD